MTVKGPGTLRNGVQVLICATLAGQKPSSSNVKPQKSGANEDLNAVMRPEEGHIGQMTQATAGCQRLPRTVKG